MTIEKFAIEHVEAPNKLSSLADAMPNKVMDVKELDRPIGLTQEVENNDKPRIKTKNEDLMGQTHPETGVPFKEKTVETSSGEKVEGVFPVFESVYDVWLPDELLVASDREQFGECNSNLKSWVESNPDDAKKLFSSEQIGDISTGRTPEGYTWHHHEDKGVMQLVDTETHAKTGHTGGKSVWGGGAEYR